jgi:phosphoribosylamine--glycine ligase
MPKQRVLVIGSGGREHALCMHLAQHESEVFCAPGSDGIAEQFKTFSFRDYAELFQKIQEHKIDLVVVGPEKYLADGIADDLSSRGVSVFGPTRASSLLEADKAWAKTFCLRHKIPMARSSVVRSPEELASALKSHEIPYVIKASGLAAGKGVWIGSNLSEALSFGSDALKGHSSVVVEEFLQGEELSFFAMVEGSRFLILGSAQDHKRLLENDEGPNTGGMGAYSPVPISTPELEAKIVERILKPTLAGLEKEKLFYRGFLFLGVMVKNNEPYLLEYNCRLGDPETQALMMRLETPIVSLIDSLSNHPITASLSKKVALNVVVAARGYPDKPDEGFDLGKLDGLPENCKLFHSGTRRANDRWQAKGGRLFSVNAAMPSLLDCQQTLYPWIEGLSCQDKIVYRKDIAVKAYRHLRDAV